MHIAHMVTGHHLYGLAQQMLYLLEGLAATGVQCTHVCPPDSAICSAAANLDCETVAIPMAGGLDGGVGQRVSRWLNAGAISG
jgi:hypothetical protein